MHLKTVARGPLSDYKSAGKGAVPLQCQRNNWQAASMVTAALVQRQRSSYMARILHVSFCASSSQIPPRCACMCILGWKYIYGNADILEYNCREG